MERTLQDLPRDLPPMIWGNESLNRFRMYSFARRNYQALSVIGGQHGASKASLMGRRQASLPTLGNMHKLSSTSKILGDKATGVTTNFSYVCHICYEPHDFS